MLKYRTPAVVVALIAGVLVGCSLPSNNGSTSTWEGPQAKPTFIPQMSATPTPQLPPGSVSGDGEYIVGAEDGIQPGTYKTTGQRPDAMICYWARDRNLTEGYGSIIANGMVEAGSNGFVQISPGDVRFRTKGCYRWDKIK